MALPPCRAVVFDLDGTLVDSLVDITKAVNRTLVSYGLAPVTKETVRSRIGHGARALVERSVGEGVDLEGALERYRQAYLETLTEETAPFAGMVEILEDLGKVGVVRGVATNKPSVFTNPLLEALSLTDRLDGWASGDECARKPDPAPLRLALERAGASDLSSREVIYVGDMPVDVTTARAFGSRCLGVTWGLDPEGLRKAEPDEIIESPEALRRALGLEP